MSANRSKIPSQCLTSPTTARSSTWRWCTAFTRTHSTIRSISLQSRWRRVITTGLVKTTLDVGSDFYVANRGNNTIVRMSQDGTVVAVREVRLADGSALGNGRLNGIAGSPPGTNKIWVTVVGHLAGHGNLTGAVLELPAF